MTFESLSRRSLLKLALVAGVGMGATVSGCSTPPTDEASWSMWSSSADEDKVWADFSSYVEDHLRLTSVPSLTPSDGYVTKLDLQLVSGTASLVTAINGWLLPTYAARGALRSLDDLIEGDSGVDLDDFYPDIKSISAFGGETYALGFDVAPTVLYYNKTMFDAQGIPVPSPTEPMSWQDFRELAMAFSEPKDQYGFTCAPSIDDLVSWIYSAGGNVMNDEQNASSLQTDESRHGMQFVIDLFVKDRATPPITNLVTTSALSSFIDGSVAFMQNGPWQVVNMRKAEFEWDIIPFPAGPAGSTPRVSGSSFAIPAGSPNVDLAWRLLKTLTSKGALEIYAQAGRNNPARKSAGVDFQPPPANLGIVQRILDGELAGGHPFDVTTNWGEVRTLLGQDLPRSFLGQITLDEAIRQINPRLDVLMAQHSDNLRQNR